MHSEILFFGFVAVIVLLLSVLGYRLSRVTGGSIATRLVSSIAAALVAHLVVVVAYLAGGLVSFADKCKPLLGGEYDCSAFEYLSTIGVLVGAGMVPWLPLFGLTWFLVASLGQRNRH